MASQPARTVQLGRYEIVKHLAQGGMADVLIARSSGIEGFERHVVIKRIRSEQSRDLHYVQMFLDEARLAASLHHQNVVQVHDIGQENGEYFFAMEYVHGQDVRKLLMELSERGLRPPLEHVITIVTGAAAGLHHAHEQRGPDRKPLGIVHRDVSPANILLGYDGSVKVADFGIAKAAHRTSETQSGNMKGKTAYMSPEQCTGSAVDRRSDVFALGIVLWELCTVRRLFNAENDFLTMTAIVQGDYPKPSKYWPALAPELDAIIMKALAAKPDDRYATVDDLRLALEEFATKIGVRTSFTALADYMKQQFPHQPLPWQVEDDEPEMYLSIDFADSVVGQEVPDYVLDELLAAPPPASVTPDAPLMRARSRAITGRHSRPNRAITAVPADPPVDPRGTTLTNAAPVPPAAAPVPSAPVPAAAPVSPAAARVPAPPIKAREPAPASPPRRRNGVAGAIVIVAIAGVALAVVFGMPKHKPAPAGVAPSRPAPPSAHAEPPPAPAPPPTEPAVATPPVDTAARPAGSDPSEPPKDVARDGKDAKDSKKHHRSKGLPKTEQKRWDPHSLLPK